jgi:hypothetical protein
MSDGHTTEFLRRRVWHWKTTIAGVGSIVCPIAAILWPQYAQKILLISSLFSGWGFITAADGSNVQQPK